ncbi:EAL domain-containing protein [Peribacillus loiseleuriae]|uniref:EAL domain-containing protein n=1 Tax=Peribacillus loiseleuriae TaxID=1679170 RepID=UPI003D04C116
MPSWKETTRKLVTLRQLGIKLSIDDFGVSCSVGIDLSCIPIDTLKMDQSFICHLHMYIDDIAVVNTFFR